MVRAQARCRRRAAPPIVGVVGIAIALAGCAPRAPRAPAVRHILLLTVDTWRADHSFGRRADVALTPALERFADRAIRYRRAYSAGNVTSAGLAGVLTGLLPLRSGVVQNEHVLQPSVPTLATLLHDAGFATVAFVANPVIAPGNGFEHGFDQYRWIRHLEGDRKAHADAVTDAALAWLDDADLSRPSLLWVHYMDPHGPYLPPQESLELFPVDAFPGSPDVPLNAPGNQAGEDGIPAYQQWGQRVPSRDPRHYLARYAAEVHFVDRQLGRLLETFEARGLLDSWAVAVTADHGEALAGDHGFHFSHGHGVTEDQIRVPLVLYYPGCDAGGSREAPASTLDLVPTLLELAGIPAPADLDGRSLIGVPGAPVVSQAYQGAVVVDWPWKLLRNRGGDASLFDLASDPSESLDLSAERPEIFQRLDLLLRQASRRQALAAPASRHDLDPQMREQLEALGYL